MTTIELRIEGWFLPPYGDGTKTKRINVQSKPFSPPLRGWYENEPE